MEMFVYYGVKIYLAYLLIMYFACQYENPKADKPMLNTGILIPC